MNATVINLNSTEKQEAIEAQEYLAIPIYESVDNVQQELSDLYESIKIQKKENEQFNEQLLKEFTEISDESDHCTSKVKELKAKIELLKEQCPTRKKASSDQS
ncbi:uncharacterized protein MONOS_3767 [Monocercomonoides exilis]|uniref:uncharacterized protein n=1 Tax=Monocercomonoides exilis TaxID=2049356 RepID=UPI00355ABB29|nr:hypothetical protein MONOS_3767 [Monocercomonoides exilis]|eukprot:MONOS_3767.1-p1 / transcript=MONOS_3767.1 / gene=MONOS_3767 / organism=Monocercomonoides_exilis_PA203 / gene_product=unspecified product / transcript_product=unspecified product / location=Mono_scaffold00092:14668-15027(-) / protein_length=103 / sequence_SO=supercontig / SO=protein_coding / is_pseudo=false